jgi:two-component system, NtrC family, response regulator AtoC
LYYRLLGLSIELPPLRDRKEDIPALSKHFLAQYAKDNRMGTISLSSEAQEKLLSYPYPGNIRELRAVVELSAVMCDNGVVLAKDIIFSHQGLLSDMLKEEDTLRGYTRRIVKHYLDRYHNDIDKVAERLDMGRSTLYKMRKDGEI